MMELNDKGFARRVDIELDALGYPETHILRRKAVEIRDRAERAEAEVERLKEALTALDKAASEVARRGAETGSQWSRLTIASLKARAALQEKPSHD